MASIYTSHLTYADLVTSQSVIEFIQREIEAVKKMYVYTDPYSAGHLIKWEIETPDYSFVKEDF